MTAIAQNRAELALLREINAQRRIDGGSPIPTGVLEEVIARQEAAERTQPHEQGVLL